jgi:hypothetical protein
MRGRIAWACCLVAGLAGPGCDPGTGSLSGTVQHDGKPVVLGTVTVVDATGRPYSGAIQPDGRYVVNNVPVGPVKIAVASPDPKGDPEDPKPGPSDDGSPPPKKVAGWRPIPAHYADAKTSGLTFDLKRGPNSLDIDLTGKDQ